MEREKTACSCATIIWIPLQEKYDKVVSDCSMLNKKLQQTQDQNQKDIETRIQVIMFIIMSIINYKL